MSNMQSKNGKDGKDIRITSRSDSRTTSTSEGIAEITQGSWEAEGKVVVISPESKSGTLTRTPRRSIILYEPSTIGYGNYHSHHGHHDVGRLNTNSDFDQELEVNARAIAAVPDMLELLRKIFVLGSQCNCIPEEYGVKIAKLLMQIYNINYIAVNQTFTIKRYSPDENENNENADDCDDDDIDEVVEDDEYDEDFEDFEDDEDDENDEDFEDDDKYDDCDECDECEFRDSCCVVSATSTH